MSPNNLFTVGIARMTRTMIYEVYDQVSNGEAPETWQKRNTTRATETGGGPAVTIHVSRNAHQGEPLRRHRRHQNTATGARRHRVLPSFDALALPLRNVKCRHSATVVRSFTTSVSRTLRSFGFARCRYHHYHNRGVGTSAVEEHNHLPPPQSVARNCTRRRNVNLLLFYFSHTKNYCGPRARVRPLRFCRYCYYYIFFSVNYGC